MMRGVRLATPKEEEVIEPDDYDLEQWADEVSHEERLAERGFPGDND